jgi:urea transport system substrate-binding protein
MPRWRAGKLEPVVVDPASNWPLFAEKRQLLGQDKVSVIFGCWTSVSRKSVLPVVRNGLLFYPCGTRRRAEQERVLHRCGAEPAGTVDYLMSKAGGKRWVLGTDYVYPRTTKILRAYLKSRAWPTRTSTKIHRSFGLPDHRR